jgi:Ca2+-binding EF-hand superfamily protein
MKPIVTLLTVLGLASFSFGAEGDAKKPEGEKGKPKANPEEAFKKMDKDSNGSVSKEEFMASPMAKKDAAKAEAAFGKKDKDANGSLSLDEFKAAPKKKKAA